MNQTERATWRRALAGLALALVSVSTTHAQPIASPRPSWQILALLYQTTDLFYRDSTGREHRVVGTLSSGEMAAAEAILRRFVFDDVPALTSQHQRPSLTVRRPVAPLSRLSRVGQRSWWPAPADLGGDGDPSFDTIIVVWQTEGIDQYSGLREGLSREYGGLATWSEVQTYVSASIFGGNLFGFGRNLLKHEWGHGITGYYDRFDVAPKPAVDNHINDTDRRYVNCLTGAPYILVDETDSSPIPNSIYNNYSGFTHDYYSGTTATADQPQRCLGITPAAWATGGPVTKPGRATTPTQLTAQVNGAHVTFLWEAPDDGPPVVSYLLEAGNTPGFPFGGTAFQSAGTTFAVDAVPPGTYYARVRAVTTTSLTGASDDVKVVVSPCTPAAPMNLAATVNDTAVGLAWTAGASVCPPTGYVVQAGSAPGLSDLAVLAVASNALAVTAPRGTYFVRVVAMNAAGTSGPSNEVAVTVGSVPEPPSQLEAIVSGSTVSLLWRAATSGGAPATYVIEAGSASGAANLASLTTGSVDTSFVAASVPAGTYFVRVRARNEFGASAASNEATFTIAAHATALEGH